MLFAQSHSNVSIYGMNMSARKFPSIFFSHKKFNLFYNQEEKSKSTPTKTFYKTKQKTLTQIKKYTVSISSHFWFRNYDVTQ